MADPRNLVYWKYKTMESILSKRKTPCPTCGGVNNFVKSFEGLTVMGCSSCDTPIRLLIEEPHLLREVVG